jgi:hypothetical protein
MPITQFWIVARVLCNYFKLRTRSTVRFTYLFILPREVNIIRSIYYNKDADHGSKQYRSQYIIAHNHHRPHLRPQRIAIRAGSPC